MNALRLLILGLGLGVTTAGFASDVDETSMGEEADRSCASDLF
jgi:hypothetical protein